MSNVSALPTSRAPWDPADHAAPGARFVTPAEFLNGVLATVRYSMVKSVVIDALAAAADADGVLLNFEMPDFYRVHVASVLNKDLPSEEKNALVYDTFTACALMDCFNALMRQDRLLGHRGNGGSVDYRLTLPDSTPGLSR
ncbi:hypothetical protein [Amycolatopsis decaplanina]|uniref:Uncharacterized protein n=1 Tax=Amycolatopsis decaplanina DSM 44594 TaxID=1284240 RepID=M2YWH8_9PSEU|nr:hypothetical protein [Amycolatopsis decaplanina]EME59262.1 hypothetical protein H074_16796 [Amycolatopsis decaplanina DSM 44594]